LRGALKVTRSADAREQYSLIVHIGYHKTATSWLQQHVFGNPDTGLGTIGKFGSDHPVRALIRARPLEFDAEACRAQFDPLIYPVLEAGLVPVISYERLSGHPVSGGYDSKEIAERLKKVFPDAKVLIVIREQRGMIVSTFKQYVMGGGTSTLAGFLEPTISQNMRRPFFDLRHFEYDHLLRYYLGLFGEEAVLVLAFEQFLDDPASYVAAIGRFTGRPLDGELIAALPFHETRRPAMSALEIEVRRRRNQLLRSELNPAPAIESRLLKRLSKLVEKAATKPFAKRLVAKADASLRQGVADHVGDYYRESNRRTAELTGIDLDRYGWTI
jgi:hypothetical protein